MVSQKFLFADFLTDPKIYALNQGFWTAQLRSKLPHETLEKEHLYQMHFANGKKIYDGNPIYSALLKNQKSVRIIQKQPESERPEIKAWIHNTESDGIEIQELVISLELSYITKSVAMTLIAAWSKSEGDKKWMEGFIREKLGTVRSTALLYSYSEQVSEMDVFPSRKSISGQYKDKVIHRGDLNREKAIKEGLSGKKATQTHIKNQEETQNDQVLKKTKRGHKSTI